MENKKHECEKCRRQGDLVIQEVQPPLKFKESERPRAWVFRYYLCRYHRAAANRNRLRHCKRLVVTEYIEDATLLANSSYGT